MKRTPQQLQQIADTKTAALALLDAEGPLHVRVLQDRLKLQGQEGVRLLEIVLREARDKDKRAVQVEGKRGTWRAIQPGQQPLPVPPAAPAPDLLALTGLRPGTIDLLRNRLARARDLHPNVGYGAGDYLGALLVEAGEVAGARMDEHRRDEFLDVAVVALRAYEALS